MKEPLLYKMVRPIIKFLFLLLYKPKIMNNDNIPKEGKLILAGNHTNYFDCLLLVSSTNRVIHFLAKDSLYKGIKKPLFKNMGIIPVNRKIHDKNAIIKAMDVLNDNKVIGIFPEGTINRSDDLTLPFKIGAVKLSKEKEAPIVPFIIKGEYKIFKRGLEITFLKPYTITSNNLDVENKKLRKKIEYHLKG